MVSRAVTQLYDDILRPSGLRVTQFSLLATIARRGEANLKQLEHALAIDQTTLTRSVNLLERDRVIERVPNPDGRVKAMRLTGKGNDCWTWRGRSGPRRRAGSSASSASRHGATPSAASPGCFTSPS
jgi:DNA-binding MarR family transcriptional regulator